MSILKRDHTKISPTAFNHIIWRTFYGIPLADEFLMAAKKYCSREYLFHKNIFKKKTKKTTLKVAPIFEGRYKGGAEALEKFIKRNPDCTILELAAGFSLHGANLVRKYPKIKYIETDLPEIIGLKEKIIKNTGANKSNLSFQIANALDARSIKKIISKAVRPNSKIAVYCEGLLSYFSDKEKKEIAEIVRTILKKYGGVWITPDPAMNAKARGILKDNWPDYNGLMQKAEKMAKQKYDDHGFKNEKETDKFFRSCGFKVRKHNWPAELKSWQTAGYKEKKEIKLRSILKKYGKVWILSLH